jgi:hypothetical protein
MILPGFTSKTGVIAFYVFGAIPAATMKSSFSAGLQ